MPRGARSAAPPADAAGAALSRARAEFVKLERRLALAAWLNSLLGYRDNREMLQDLKGAAEGFDGEGRSYIWHDLAGRGPSLRIDLATLARYDDNIKRHLDAMNRYRPEPIQLRYFQYLAVLFTEIFLDRWFNHRAAFVAELNQFVEAHNASLRPGDEPYPRFEEADLDKLALWMATGSGKTLIMHFNYRQFLDYNRRALDNILLITPNEGMTEQHLEEMRLSGIPCERFLNTESGLGLGDRDMARVIDIHKLVEEKKGAGVSVPVEAFEGNNLIFVDEGHKGSGGETWRRYRDALGQTGFTFEYSATFGQALTAARNDALAKEYGKAIAFDYSYPYFYGDGFGKDFRVLNLKDDTSEDMTETLLLANLLSFYQQQRCFRAEAAAIAPYNLEAPLWVFVGSSVNAVYREAGRERSDVLTVARFLHRFLCNEHGWATSTISRLLEGRTGLLDKDGNDAFEGRFWYFHDIGLMDATALYTSILRDLFHADSSAGLHMATIRSGDGELGLKASPMADYFGVIYIGDAGAFRKLVEADDAGITLEPDEVIGPSLFGSISLPRSPVQVLIGAKKFMEGWSSWRVSNMGLLNIGRSEGSEIIQLFGRGVRLRGKGFTLKRSRALDGTHPPNLPLLETLEIFAVRANYMAQFRDYLEREGVDTEGAVEIALAIRRNDEFLGKGLLTLRLPAGKDNTFHDDYHFLLEPDEAAKATVDLSLKVESLASTHGGLVPASAQAGTETRLPSAILDLLNWEAIYLDLLEHKEDKGYSNLVIPRDNLRAVIESEDPALYTLVAPDAIARPQTFAGLAATQDAVLAILRSYVDKLYARRRQQWEGENLKARRLTGDDLNLQDKEYKVRVPRSNLELIEDIKDLIRDLEELYEKDRGRGKLRNVYFDRHLYQPLLRKKLQTHPPEDVQSQPPALEDSAVQFVERLRQHLADPASAMPKSRVFLLRNQARGRGIGFWVNQSTHYPDFVLWIKNGNRQRIVFVEPHGMLHAMAPDVDDRLKLPDRLKRLAQKLKRARKGASVDLDYFIISATPYTDLRPTYGDGKWTEARFAAAHILFAEDDYVPDLFPP